MYIAVINDGAAEYILVYVSLSSLTCLIQRILELNNLKGLKVDSTVLIHI